MIPSSVPAPAGKLLFQTVFPVRSAFVIAAVLRGTDSVCNQGRKPPILLADRLRAGVQDGSVRENVDLAAAAVARPPAS